MTPGSFFKFCSPILSTLAVLLLLSACAGANVTYDKYEDIKAEQRARKTGVRGSVLGGEGGLSALFGDKKDRSQGGGGIGVNSFLWRASLDTISFMPVNSADPFGGVIITDWHSNAEAPGERFKLNVYILGLALRADGVRVSVFRQVRSANEWVTAPVPDESSTRIEDAILTRARQLRLETIQQ